MKFVSKSGNLSITLKPGIPNNRLTGQAYDPGLHIRFQDGMVIINDEKIIEMMKNHDGYNMDFFEVADEQVDPFKNQRKEAEPGHIITEMKYGHPEKSMASGKKFAMTPEMEIVVKEMAKTLALEMTKELAPKMATEMVKNLANKKETTEEIVTQQVLQKENEDVQSSEQEKTNEITEQVNSNVITEQASEPIQQPKKSPGRPKVNK